METVNILGINVNTFTKKQVLAKIQEFLTDGLKHQIVTPNPEIILKAAGHDKKLFYILNKADLAVPDGVALKFAAWLLGVNLSRITGADLVKDILKLAEDQGRRVAIFNWRHGLSKAEEIKSAIIKKFPKLELQVESINRRPPYNFSRIIKFSPEIIFLTLGAPYQEKFIFHNLVELPSVKIGIGVGGAFDFLTGRLKRAPKLFKVFGLEWLWRLYKQPARWKRIYNAVIVFPVKFLIWRFKKNYKIDSPPAVASAKGRGNDKLFMPTNIRLRFAPSPTGYLHIGSLWAAWFDYIIAKSLGGKFILRIEDTDQNRLVKGAMENLIEVLEWAGISFDESPKIGGSYGPYVQSERLAIYKAHSEEIIAKGGAYRCFCAPERLEQMRREQELKKMPPRYDRLCRSLSKNDISKKIRAGEKFVIRQKMPVSGEIIVYDELRGEIKFKAEGLDDQVLIKSDGFPTYHFASVVDDHLMKISFVTRGQEWIPSFPKNFLLYKSFGWEAPKFLHFPVILDKAGGKLSKRKGNVAVEEYRDKGYLPEALLNFCVLMGWHPKDEREILSLDEIIKKFKIKDMGTSPAVFDSEKLDYFNGYYIRKLPLDKLTSLCLPYLTSEGMIEEITNYDPPAGGRSTNKIPDKFKNKFTGEEISFEHIKKIVALEQERLKKLSDISQATEFFFTDKLDYAPELLIWKKMSPADAKKNLAEILETLKKIPADSWTDDIIEEAVMTHIQAKKGKVGEYLWPMRASLTGRTASPGPFQVAEVLGREKSLERIRQGIEKV